MTPKEKIFAQNWIEQFRAGRERVNSGRYFRYTQSNWHPGDSIWSYSSSREIINSAFPWEEMREHGDIWNRRYTYIEGGIIIR